MLAAAAPPAQVLGSKIFKACCNTLASKETLESKIAKKVTELELNPVQAEELKTALALIVKLEQEANGHWLFVNKFRKHRKITALTEIIGEAKANPEKTFGEIIAPVRVKHRDITAGVFSTRTHKALRDLAQQKRAAPAPTRDDHLDFSMTYTA